MIEQNDLLDDINAALAQFDAAQTNWKQCIEAIRVAAKAEQVNGMNAEQPNLFEEKVDFSVKQGIRPLYVSPSSFDKAEGRKDDSFKLRYDLIPPEALSELALVLTFGARKYSDRNWEKGMDWSRCFAALQRHVWAWWGGEKSDPETSYSHLSHALCCLVFLISYEKRRAGNDNRPKGNI